MAAMESIVKEVKEITECPICTEMFCTPKMLPCCHTFCLKCIEQYCKDKKEGDTMPCPMCRKDLLVPSGGLSKLNTNFFIERLVAVQSASRLNEVVNCDVCLAGKQCQVEASSFCMECQEHMCDPCSNIHKSMKMSMTHHLSTIRDPSTMEAIRNKILRAFCDKHPTEEIKFYCRDCKIPICTTCTIAKHNKHDFCNIGKMFGEFKKGCRKYLKDVSEQLAIIEKQSHEVEEQFASFSSCIYTTEKNILERSEAIKKMVDKHTQELIVDLNSHKTHFQKNLQTTKEELQRNMMMCENFVSYCQKAIEEADVVESIRIAEEIRTRAEELKGKPIQNFNALPDIQFHPSDFNVAKDFHNIVGNIHVKHLLKLNPLGTANDELFCVFPNSPGIAVYNTESFAYQRTISMEGMKDPFDIVAGENVLYVSEFKEKLIHRIQLPEETVSNWSVCSNQSLLSIAKNGNVIASVLPAILLEYTSVGNFVRKIVVNRICSNLKYLQHAIQLDGNKFLVCQATAPYHSSVCLIDNFGRVIKCYGWNTGSGMGQLNSPCHLAIGRNGSILVADMENNRIVQLNESLEYMNEFLGFKQPIRLHFNEELGRLYVIENKNRSITILDM